MIKRGKNDSTPCGQQDVGDSHSAPRIMLPLVIALLVILSASAGIALEVGDTLSIEKFVATIRSWGAWGVFAAIGLMVLHSFIPFPAELLACANGMVYGTVWGTVITWTGAMLGASIAFALAKFLGRPFVERIVAKKDYRVLDEWADQNGWQVILVARFIPLIAFNLINYAAGLTRIGWKQFIWTTAVGILPLTILMVMIGDNIDSLGRTSWLLLLIGGLALLLVLRPVIRLMNRRSSPL
jgi:uncharacterized membrane protein YdjX (TVP38/TMEM64 family)